MFKLLEPLLTIVAGLIIVASTAVIGYWVIKPIRRYHRIRSRIIEDGVIYALVIDPGRLDDRLLKLYERRVESNRRNAAALAACLLELPSWYLSLLQRRGHTPEGVPADLIGLSNTSDEDVARMRMNRIKHGLGLKTTKDGAKNSRVPSVMRKILTLVVMLGVDVDAEKATALSAERSKKVVAGHEYLKQQKYQEARAAFEAGIRQNPADVMAHFYLGDACQGLKAWACAEAHYETSFELNAKSSVAGLAKPRARKAKVWRLLAEGKQALTEPNAPPAKVAQAEDTLDMANRLGLDEEQRVVYQQLHEKIQQRHAGNHVNSASVQSQDRSMVLVPAGEFIMGSATGDADERPKRRVYLDAFFMDTNHTTVEQYATFLEATFHEAPPEWNIMNRPMHQKRPVVNVEWADAAAYCTWAGKRQPTEAEWEKAARGTDGRTYPWGNESPTRVHANLRKETWSNHYGLSTVGSYEDGKSPYGIHDMAGNVWEWVSDWYDSEYYKTAPLRNPTGPATGTSKVVRGGSWGSGPEGSALCGTGNPCAVVPGLRHRVSLCQDSVASIFRWAQGENGV